MWRHSLLFIVFCGMLCGVCNAQTVFVKECRQVEFHSSVPAGNYSGIARIGGNEYAVVSDKSVSDGFFVFEIDVDSVSGEILDVRNKGFMSGNTRAGDCEGIVFRRSSGTCFVSREADASIVEYASDGKETGRKLCVPPVFLKSGDGSRSSGMGNYGFEALAYDENTRTFWTMNESTLKSDGQQATSQNGVKNILRLQSFGDDLMPLEQYVYVMDAPEAHSKASEYAMGVSELVALGNGRFLVLEREFYVPKLKLGAFMQCKIYEIEPGKEFVLPENAVIGEDTKYLPKRLVHSFNTKLSIFNKSIANYEGMCLGPQLADGSVALILVSDSQNQYKGVLKDWFKSVIIRLDR